VWPPRACVRVYARVLVPPNLYIHTSPVEFSASLHSTRLRHMTGLPTVDDDAHEVKKRNN